MKKILVPTDFSSNAANALNYAIQVAKKAGSELLLVHTFKVPSHSGVLISMEKEYTDSNKREMDSWLQDSGITIPEKVKLRKNVVMGYTNAVITSVCKREGIDLVIMGTQGATGLEEVFLGSNTVSLIKKTDRAVLAIPEGYQYSKPKTVVLAVDEFVVNREEVLKPLLEILRIFKANLKIIHVTPKGVPRPEGGFRKNFANLFHDFDYEYLHLKSENISDVLQRYTTSVKAEMLCMISRKRNWLFDRLFNASVTYKTAFHTNLPFLVLSDT